MCPPDLKYGFSKTEVYDIRFFSNRLGQKSLVCMSFVVSYLSELINYSTNSNSKKGNLKWLTIQTQNQGEGNATI